MGSHTYIVVKLTKRISRRAKPRRATRFQIRSGGQSGVDRAALDIAIKLEIEYAGWCPRGGWAEDHASSPGVLARYSKLRETPSADPKQRTAWNVRDSTATLMLVRGRSWDSPGTTFTRECAELIFDKPFYSQDINATDALGRTTRWLEGMTHATKRAVFVLNVAGPRESESPGIYESAAVFLEKLFQEIVYA